MIIHVLSVAIWQRGNGFGHVARKVHPCCAGYFRATSPNTILENSLTWSNLCAHHRPYLQLSFIRSMSVRTSVYSFHQLAHALDVRRMDA